MNDLLEAKNGAGIFNPLDALRKIEVIKGEIPHAIKNFKAEVAEFSSMDRKLSSLKAKAHKKAKIKTLEKIEAFEDEYRCEYEKCKSSLADIENLLEEISILYLNLAEYYSSYGKGKSAKKNRKSAEKFDKAARKQLDPLVAILNSANELSEIELQEEADEEFKVPEEKNCENSATEEKANCSSDSDERVRRDERVDREYNNPYHYRSCPNNSHDPYYPPHDYRMPPMYYQPMPSFNIAPISIDVNSAVDSAIANFKNAFEERFFEYLSSCESPKANRRDVTEGESRALDKVIEDENFAIGKLSELLEKINGLLTGISELTSVCSDLEEKNRELADSMKNANDTHRTLVREIQGIQAIQKVLGGDQLKLAEEQAVVVEEQKAAIIRQAELADAEGIITEEVNTLFEGVNKNIELIKASAVQQGDIAKALNEAVDVSNKIFELQKNLEERQSELAEMQRESLAAHKKLARAQKAINERSLAKAKLREEKAVENQKVFENEENSPEVVEEISINKTEDVVSTEEAAVENAEVTEAAVEEAFKEEAETVAEELSEKATEEALEEITEATV